MPHSTGGGSVGSGACQGFQQGGQPTKVCRAVPFLYADLILTVPDDSECQRCSRYIYTESSLKNQNYAHPKLMTFAKFELCLNIETIIFSIHFTCF